MIIALQLHHLGLQNVHKHLTLQEMGTCILLSFTYNVAGNAAMLSASHVTDITDASLSRLGARTAGSGGGGPPFLKLRVRSDR